MSRRASEAEIRAAERELGVRLPADHARFLCEVGGREVATDLGYARLYDLREILDLHVVTREHQARQLPGIVYIGDDGSREGLVYDFRAACPPLVLVEHISTGWAQGLFQAPDLTTFLQQFAVSGWVFDTPYGAAEPPGGTSPDAAIPR